MPVETIIVAYLENRLLPLCNNRNTAVAALCSCRRFRLRLEQIEAPGTEYIPNTIAVLLDIEDTLTALIQYLIQPDQYLSARLNWLDQRCPIPTGVGFFIFRYLLLKANKIPLPTMLLDPVLEP